MNLETRIKTACSALVIDELEYYMRDVEHEGPYTYADALVDVSDRADEPGLSALRRDCHEAFMRLGLLIPVSKNHIMENIKSGGGCKLTHFPKIGDQRYEYRCSTSQWLEEINDAIKEDKS